MNWNIVKNGLDAVNIINHQLDLFLILFFVLNPYAKFIKYLIKSEKAW